MTVHEPPPELLAGRRALESVAELTILKDWEWCDRVAKWVLFCRIEVDVSPAGLVPVFTDWYIVVADTYPWGLIKFYPADKRGIELTFPHQNLNAPGPETLPWRTGDLCLATPVRALGRHGYDDEPFDMHQRLRWYVERALRWLQAASRDELLQDGDPYELPQFVPRTLEHCVAFSEGPDSADHWHLVPERSGIIEFGQTPSRREGRINFTVQRFLGDKGQTLAEHAWGSILQQDHDKPAHRGIWLRLDACPLVKPWQAPLTWRQLGQACREQDVKLLEVIERLAPQIRDGRQHILLIGFPIPNLVGDTPCQMHWQALALPVLSHDLLTRDGFRPGEKGYWARDRTRVFHGDRPIDWVMSTNWHFNQISSRGRWDEAISTREILIVGAGALGSTLAELLLRAGAHKLMIMDPDWLEVGNLVRHTLQIDQIGERKALAVAQRLNLASPHATVTGLTEHFPPIEGDVRTMVQSSQLVIDTTGSDEVAHTLGTFPWQGERAFASISLGMEARRLFCFLSYGNTFPEEEFRKLLDPWLGYERNEFDDEELPWEGIGCWHPVFPARIDAIWLLASAVVKNIVEMIAPSGNRHNRLIVIEQRFENGSFAGLDIADRPPQL